MFYLVFGVLLLQRRLGAIVMGVWMAASVVALWYAPQSTALAAYVSPLHLLFAMGMLIPLALRRISIDGAPLAAVGVIGFIGCCVVQNMHWMDGNFLYLIYGLFAATGTLGFMLLERMNRLRVPKILVFLGDAILLALPRALRGAVGNRKVHLPSVAEAPGTHGNSLHGPVCGSPARGNCRASVYRAPAASLDSQSHLATAHGSASRHQTSAPCLASETWVEGRSLFASQQAGPHPRKTKREPHPSRSREAGLFHKKQHSSECRTAPDAGSDRSSPGSSCRTSLPSHAASAWSGSSAAFTTSGWTRSITSPRSRCLCIFRIST